MKLMHSCEEASRLLSQALDEPLGLLDRTLLQLHLSMCGNCAEVDRQLKALRSLTTRVFDEAGEALREETGEEPPASPR
jgi:hypothetical protein